MMNAIHVMEVPKTQRTDKINIKLHTHLILILSVLCVLGTSIILSYTHTGWWRGRVVERRSLAGELSLSCARPAADG